MFSRTQAIFTAAAIGTLSANAHAAEGFQLRYNIAGSLGGEMFSPPDTKGFAMGLAATYIDVNKVTGDDGNVLTKAIPGGTVPLPSPVPSALYPRYAANTAQVDGTGTFKLWNLALGYVTTDSYGGGRFAFGAVVPYGTKTQTFHANATTPALQWSPLVPPSIQSSANAQFGAAYQAGLASQAASETGEVSGLGDVELQAGWLYTAERLRVLAGASLVLPTGKYDSNPGPDIGYGNFYTFRPAVQASYLPTDNTAVAVKLTWGINTRNRDNDVRSGNWIGLENALAYKSAIGVFGLHTVFVQQYQSDSNNPWGTSRYRTVNAGAFFTTKVPGIDAAVTIQYMRTVASHNAKAGDFTQIRIIKVF